MSIAWIAPAALIGLGLIALPIAIHLLVRQHARRLAYPSLRFLRETQLAAFRRRTIQDAALLLCRAVIIALAAIALAGPVLRTASRTAGYASRTSRAIVAIEGADDARLPGLADGAFASRVFKRSSIADALIDAVRWLDQQPPSSREIVVSGRLHRGSIGDSDLAFIPKEIGIRFENAGAPASSDVVMPMLARRNGTLMRVNRAVHLDAGETRVAEGEAVALPDDLVAIVAADTDKPLAEAALRAVLDAGVAWTDFDRRVLIVWEGADERSVDRAARMIRMPVPSPPSAAADAVLDAINESSSRPERLEPVMIAAEQLSAWSRAPLAPGASGQKPPGALRDEGDRRWVWGLVLLLLALEGWIRRSRPEPAISAESEARVA